MSRKSQRPKSQKHNYALLNTFGFTGADNLGEETSTASECDTDMADLHTAEDADLLAQDADLDALLQAEQAEQKEIEAEEEKRDKIKAIMRLRQDNAARRRKMADVVKGDSDDQGQGHKSRQQKRKKQLGQDVDLLNDRARRRGASHTSTDTSSSSSRSSSSSSSSSAAGSLFSLKSSDSRGKKKSKSKKAKSKSKQKSGIHAKSSKWVKKPQTYPHALLDNQYVMNETRYKDLSFGQFVAGELEVILSGKMKTRDAESRLEMLRKTAYRSLTFEWAKLLQIHAAILRQIELGKADWTSNFDQVERLILENASSASSAKPLGKTGFQGASNSGARVKGIKGEGKSGNNVESRSWWCKEFQNNSCNLSSPHMKRIGGKMYSVKHFCASCYQMRKVELGHPEKSAACPYYEEGAERRDL